MNEYQYISNYKDIIRQNTYCVIWKIIDHQSRFKNYTMMYTDSGVPYINAYFRDSITLCYDVFENGVKKYSSNNKTIDLSEYENDVRLNVSDIDNDVNLISYITSNNAYVTDFIILLTDMPEIEKIEYTNEEIIYDEELKCNLLYMNEQTLDLNANVYFKDGTIKSLSEYNIGFISSNTSNISITNNNVLNNHRYFDTQTQVGYSFVKLNLDESIFSNIENVPKRIKVICSYNADNSVSKTDLIKYKYIQNKLVFRIYDETSGIDVFIDDYKNIYSIIQRSDSRGYSFKIYSKLTGIDKEIIKDVTNSNYISSITCDPVIITITNSQPFNFNPIALGDTELTINLNQENINLEEYDLELPTIYITLKINNQRDDAKWEVINDENGENKNDRIININRFLDDEQIIETIEIDELYSEEDDNNYLEDNSTKDGYTNEYGIFTIDSNYQIHLGCCIYKQYILENNIESEPILIDKLGELGLLDLPGIKIDNRNQLNELQYIYAYINDNKAFEKFIVKKFKKENIKVEENTNYFAKIYVTLDNINDTRIKIDKQVFFTIQDDNEYEESKLMKWNVNIDEMLITEFDYNLDITPAIEQEIDISDYSNYPYIKVLCKYSNEEDYESISDKCSFEYDESLIQLIKSNTTDNVWYIKPLKTGECDIKLLNKFILHDQTEDSNCTETFHIIIRKVIDYINFDKYELTINVGDKEEITAEYYPSDATYPKLSWFSSDDSIATIVKSNKEQTKKDKYKDKNVVDRSAVITGINEGVIYVGLNEKDTKEYLPDFIGYTNSDGIANIKIYDEEQLITHQKITISQIIKCYVTKTEGNVTTIKKELYNSDTNLENCLVEVLSKALYIKIPTSNIYKLIDDINGYDYEDDLSDLFDDNSVEYNIVKEFKINVSFEDIEGSSDYLKTITLQDSNNYKQTLLISDSIVNNNIQYNLLEEQDTSISEYEDDVESNDNEDPTTPEIIIPEKEYSNIWKYCIVRVKEVQMESISLAKKSVTLDIGKIFNEDVEYVNINISPENTTHKDISYEIKNNKNEDDKSLMVCDIELDENDKPVLKLDPIREGTCSVKVYSIKNPEIFDECSITIINTKLQKIEITGGTEDDDYEWYDNEDHVRTIERFAKEDFPRYKLALNNSVQLKANLIPSGTVNRGVKWYSSNPDLVKCTEDGICTAVRYGSQELELYAEDNWNVSDDDDKQNSDRYPNTCWITCVSTETNVSAICQIRVFRNNITKIEIDADEISSTDDEFIDIINSYERYDERLDTRDDQFNYIINVGEKIELPIKFTTQDDSFAPSNNIVCRGAHGFAEGLDISECYINHNNAYDDDFDWKIHSVNQVNNDKKEIVAKIKGNLIGDYDLYLYSSGKSGTINRDKHDGEYYSYGFPEEGILDENGEIKFTKHDLKVKLLYKGDLYEEGGAIDQRIPEVDHSIDPNGIPAIYNHNITINSYFDIIPNYNTKQIKDRIKEIVSKYSAEKLYKNSNNPESVQYHLDILQSKITDESTEEEIAQIEAEIASYLAEIQESFSNNLISNLYITIDNLFNSGMYTYPLTNEEKTEIKDTILNFFPFENDDRNNLESDLYYLLGTDVHQLETNEDKLKMIKKLHAIIANNPHSNPEVVGDHYTTDINNFTYLVKPYTNNEKSQIYKCLDQEIFYGYGLPTSYEEKLEIYNALIDIPESRYLPLSQNEIRKLWQDSNDSIESTDKSIVTLIGLPDLINVYDISGTLGQLDGNDIFKTTGDTIASQFIDLFRPFPQSQEFNLKIINTGNFMVLTKYNVYFVDENGKSLLPNLGVKDINELETVPKIVLPIIKDLGNKLQIELPKDLDIDIDKKFIILATDENLHFKQNFDIRVIDYRGEETTILDYRTNDFGSFTYIPLDRPTYSNVYKIWNDTIYIINTHILNLLRSEQNPEPQIDQSAIQTFYDEYFNNITLKIFKIYKSGAQGVIQNYMSLPSKPEQNNKLKNVAQMIFNSISNYKVELKDIKVEKHEIPEIKSYIDSNNIIKLSLPYQYEYANIKNINQKDNSLINESLMYDKRFIPRYRYTETEDGNGKPGRFEIITTNLENDKVTGYVIEVNGKKYSDDLSKIIDSVEYGKSNNSGILAYPIKDSDVVTGYTFNYNGKPTEHPGCGVWRKRVKSNLVRIRVIYEDTGAAISIIGGNRYVTNTNSMATINSSDQYVVPHKVGLPVITSTLKLDSHSSNHKIILALIHSKKYMEILEESVANYRDSKLPDKWDSYAWFTSDPNVFTLEEVQPEDMRDPENSKIFRYAKYALNNEGIYGKKYLNSRDPGLQNNLWFIEYKNQNDEIIKEKNLLDENYFASSKIIALVPQGPGTAILTCKSVMGKKFISRKVIIN